MKKSLIHHDLIHQEAQAIWHIAEVLGKVGAGNEEDGVTLSGASLRYFAREISERLTRLVEGMEEVIRGGWDEGCW